MPVTGFSFDNGYRFGHVRVVEEDGEYKVILTKYVRPHCVKTETLEGTYKTKSAALSAAERIARAYQR